jgi:ribonuclease HI
MPATGSEACDYEVYTDGSYIRGKVTYGFIILHKGVPVHEGGAIVPEAFAKSRQVGGEIYAVLTALKWFEENGIPSASVHYDFENLALWVRGVYKANTEISRALVDAVRRSPVKLSWRKVRAHTGVHWNERVDEIAKQAAFGGSAPAAPVASVTSEGPEQTGGNPFVDELERIVEPLQAAAAADGIDTRYVGVLNNQFARLEVLAGDKRVGMFDLYNTQKKRLNPIVSPAGSREAARMMEIWNQFIRVWGK